MILVSKSRESVQKSTKRSCYDQLSMALTLYSEAKQHTHGSLPQLYTHFIGVFLLPPPPKLVRILVLYPFSGEVAFLPCFRRYFPS